MRWGCCGSPAEAEAVRAAGFDFLEVGVQPVLRGLEDDTAWSATAPDVDKLPLPLEAANGLLPATLPIVGPERDLAALTRYMENVARRAKRLGIQRLVFGSGGARRRPDGTDPATAQTHLADFAEMAAEACCRHDIILVVEHLNRGETNTINSLRDELDLIERVGHRSLAALVDTYHLGLEGDSDEEILALGNRIRHVHVAEVKDRLHPGAHGDSADAYDFESFFCLLHKLGYDERISIEAKWARPIAEAGAETSAFLRKAWADASRCGQ